MYSTDSEGKFIPATQRPDGTWRKARRVKEGYVPQEEVPLYESKGKQFAQRKNKTGLPPGMCPVVAEAVKKEREKQERAKAKKEAAANKKQQTPGILLLPTEATVAKAGTAAAARNSPKASTNNTDATTANAPAIDEALSKDLASTLQLEEPDNVQEAAKQLKKLRKKLREIDTIEAKIKSGELKKPEKDQLDKVKRKKEILKEIKRLEEEEEQAAKGGI